MLQLTRSPWSHLCGEAPSLRRGSPRLAMDTPGCPRFAPCCRLHPGMPFGGHTCCALHTRAVEASVCCGRPMGCVLPHSFARLQTHHVTYTHRVSQDSPWGWCTQGVLTVCAAYRRRIPEAQGSVLGPSRQCTFTVPGDTDILPAVWRKPLISRHVVGTGAVHS